LDGFRSGWEVLERVVTARVRRWSWVVVFGLVVCCWMEGLGGVEVRGGRGGGWARGIKRAGKGEHEVG
jgi:hypothetical protein